MHLLDRHQLFDALALTPVEESPAIPNGGGSMTLLLVADLLDRPGPNRPWFGIIEIGGSGPA
jgi:hypothetical protein